MQDGSKIEDRGWMIARLGLRSSILNHPSSTQRFPPFILDLFPDTADGQRQDSVLVLPANADEQRLAVFAVGEHGAAAE